MGDNASVDELRAVLASVQLAREEERLDHAKAMCVAVIAPAAPALPPARPQAPN